MYVHRPSFSGKNCSHFGSDHSLLWRCRVHIKMFRGGLPRWLSGKELACWCRSKVRSLVWEDPMCHGAAKPVHPNYWTCALESGSRNYWRWPALEPMLGNKRRLCDEKPQLESRPRPLQLEKDHVQQQRPIAAKNKSINNAQWNLWLLPTDRCLCPTPNSCINLKTSSDNATYPGRCSGQRVGWCGEVAGSKSELDWEPLT